jgi:hypothetical protein
MTDKKLLVAKMQMNITLDCSTTDPVWFVKQLGKLIDKVDPIIGIRWLETEWMWLDIPGDPEESDG